MRAKSIFMLTVTAALLAGCEGRDTIHERTLAQSCDPDCYFWAQTDMDRGPLGKDGMRVYIEPSFGDFSYRFEVVPQPVACVAWWPDDGNVTRENECSHYLVRMRKMSSQPIELGGSATTEDFKFILPVESASELFVVADEMSDRWRGSMAMFMDGTGVSFEIYKRGRVRSMYSNVGLRHNHRNPAAWVAAELHRFTLAYGPTGQIPRNADWHKIVDEDGRFPCNNPGLNVPDRDGFGTGDDACARSLADQPSR